jgi:hypothetical protein
MQKTLAVPLGDRAVATYDGRRIKLYIYSSAESVSVVLSPRQAFYLANNLLTHALSAER